MKTLLAYRNVDEFQFFFYKPMLSIFASVTIGMSNFVFALIIIIIIIVIIIIIII